MHIYVTHVLYLHSSCITNTLSRGDNLTHDGDKLEYVDPTNASSMLYPWKWPTDDFGLPVEPVKISPSQQNLFTMMEKVQNRPLPTKPQKLSQVVDIEVPNRPELPTFELGREINFILTQSTQPEQWNNYLNQCLLRGVLVPQKGKQIVKMSAKNGNVLKM